MGNSVLSIFATDEAGGKIVSADEQKLGESDERVIASRSAIYTRKQ